MDIRGAKILLTGATGGLGQESARELARRGGELILSGRQADVLESLAAELGARALRADLSQEGEVARLAGEAGEVDILIANAALQGGGRLESYDVAGIDEVLDVNLRAPIVLARLLMEGMVERRRGHLLFVSSLSGKVATPRSSLYNATKFALRGFAHALRADLRPSGVGVSVLCPGFVRDAGLFAKSGATLPPGVGTCTPRDVARALAGAIERNRAEVDVAPIPLRVGAAFGGLAPGIAATATRLAGGERIAERTTERTSA